MYRRIILIVDFVYIKTMDIEQVCNDCCLVTLGCKLKCRDSSIILLTNVTTIRYKLLKKLQVSVEGSIMNCRHTLLLAIALINPLY